MSYTFPVLSSKDKITVTYLIYKMCNVGGGRSFSRVTNIVFSDFQFVSSFLCVINCREVECISHEVWHFPRSQTGFILSVLSCL